MTWSFIILTKYQTHLVRKGKLVYVKQNGSCPRYLCTPLNGNLISHLEQWHLCLPDTLNLKLSKSRKCLYYYFFKAQSQTLNAWIDLFCKLGMRGSLTSKYEMLYCPTNLSTLDAIVTIFMKRNYSHLPFWYVYCEKNRQDFWYCLILASASLRIVFLMMLKYIFCLLPPVKTLYSRCL